MRRYTALFQTIGSFELYTADGRYVYDFSYLSSATSYDRADAEARRAVIKRIRTQTKASGYHILPGVVTTARTERTNEDRLCTAVRERFLAPTATPEPELEPGEASLLVSLSNGQLKVTHGADKAVLLSGPLPVGGWDKLIHTLLAIAPDAPGAMTINRKKR